MGKHAYLVLAHNQKQLLFELLQEIDYLENDIFLHIDKKFNIDLDDIKRHIVKSKCYFVDRISIGWGGTTLIEATLKLLKKSTETGKYEYYHLISGQDFPLKSQKEIHQFFEAHQGLEFISCKPMNSNYNERIKYYYYFQDVFGGRTLFNKAMKKLSVWIQRRVGVDRTKNKYKQYGIGAQWFSITDHMARYVVTCEKEIADNFYKCFCADEIFLQTIWLNAPFYAEERKYHSNISNDQYVEEIFHDVMRGVNWSRGTPYVYDERDYKMLIESGCLFARKMSEEKSMKLVYMIKKHMNNM
ncbi:MAG: beta-1,6-N-acetylglucosaminyltransferase [Lachnospiraceae bacterium]|jgi:hypothetical protein|nr:beta-1,6-N-acetylglucosaminyltransferase [Lachnospiraceae bacterium]